MITVAVTPGSIEINSIRVLHQDHQTVVLSLDCKSKYPVVSSEKETETEFQFGLGMITDTQIKVLGLPRGPWRAEFSVRQYGVTVILLHSELWAQQLPVWTAEGGSIMGDWEPLRRVWTDADGHEYEGGFILRREGKIRAHVQHYNNRTHIFDSNGHCSHAAELNEFDDPEYVSTAFDDYLEGPRRWCEKVLDEELAEAGLSC